MSFSRWVYHSSAIGGWSALAGWLVGELLLLRGAAPALWQALLLAVLAGPILGCGLSVTAGLVNAWWTEKTQRLGPGRVGSAVAGLLGGLALGPFLCVAALPASMFARACAFVVVGLALGAALAALQVLLKQAWVTYLEGALAGRQLILGSELALSQVKVCRQPDGRFVLEKQHGDAPALLNNQPVRGTVLLADGDLVRFGDSSVRFNGPGRQAPPAPAAARPGAPAASPPVPSVPRTAPARSPVPVPPPTATAPTAPASDACPRCRRRCPGAAGNRYCLVCEVKF